MKGNKRHEFPVGQIHALVKLNMEQAKENRAKLHPDTQREYKKLSEYWDQREALAQKGYPMGIFAEYKTQGTVIDAEQ